LPVMGFLFCLSVNVLVKAAVTSANREPPYRGWFARFAAWFAGRFAGGSVAVRLRFARFAEGFFATVRRRFAEGSNGSAKRTGVVSF
jgi:hypothetical protein